MALSFFAGPQHTDTTNQILIPSVALPRISVLAIPISQNSWSGAGGASYVWNGVHTGITVDAARIISDGGGLLGAVTLTTADAGLRYQLLRQYTAGIGFNYGTSNAMGAISTPYSSVESASGNVSVSRQIRERIGLTLGYGRAFQNEGNIGPSASDINHNRAWIAISYQLSRPLGQ
jgi:hypothetical protein